LDDPVRARGVVAYSSGNHAQAVAFAAAGLRHPGLDRDARGNTEHQGRATRAYGAEVVLCAPGQREVVAAEIVAKTGGVLVPPFDHPDVIAGQGTIGLEIAHDLPEVENVVIRSAGGGLASGIGTAIRALCPQARVYGVEPELARTQAKASASATAVGLVRRRTETEPSPTACAPNPQT